jgi:hypothetical protein
LMLLFWLYNIFAFDSSAMREMFKSWEESDLIDSSTNEELIVDESLNKSSNS